MVLRRDHKDIYKMMRSISEAARLNEGLLSSHKNQKVKSTTYSDSIMLYSQDKSIGAFDALVTAVSGLTNDLFIHGIPHKGAIAFGKMTLDEKRSIFFGQPLIDAFLLQEELHFYGVAIHGSVEACIEHKLETTTFVLNYPCPLKKGRSNHYTIYPMHADSVNEDEKRYVQYYSAIRTSLHKMNYATSGHLRTYIDNTNKYFDVIAESTG